MTEFKKITNPTNQNIPQIIERRKSERRIADCEYQGPNRRKEGSDKRVTYEPSIDELKSFCLEIGVPFPVEKNPEYNCWWRLLHEIGHWAVEPEWYTKWGGQIAGIKYLNSKQTEYQAGNDMVPNINLYHIVDPTCSEFQVREWCLQVLEVMGWTHPMDLGEVKKSATANLWSPSSGKFEFNVSLINSLAHWGINPSIGNFRPKEDGFELPFPNTMERLETMLNYTRIAEYYYGSDWYNNPDTHQMHCPASREYWKKDLDRIFTKGGTNTVV